MDNFELRQSPEIKDEASWEEAEEVLRRIEALDLDNSESFNELVEALRARSEVLSSQDYKDLISELYGIDPSTEHSTSEYPDPALHSFDHLKVYLDGDSIPQEWHDEVIEHEIAEMIKEVKLFREKGLPLRDATRNEHLDLILSAHSEAIKFEYKRAAEKGELEAYQVWVRQLYAEYIEGVSDDPKQEEFYRGLLGEREKMFSEFQSREEGIPMDAILEKTGIDFNSERYQKTKENIDNFLKETSERFGESNQKEVIDALALMLDLHRDQKDRPDGQPYVNHPLEVAQRVLELSESKDKNLVIAALLHDTVEDQSTRLAKGQLEQKYGQGSKDIEEDEESIRELALSEISQRYGERASSIVNSLSNPNFDLMLSGQGVDRRNKEVYHQREIELYKEHIEEAIQDPDVLVVKLADFSKNALALEALPTETKAQRAKRDWLTKKYAPVIPVFIERLQDESSPCRVKDKEQIISNLETALRNMNRREEGDEKRNGK